jgi:hypothetical protein
MYKPVAGYKNVINQNLNAIFIKRPDKSHPFLIKRRLALSARRTRRRIKMKKAHITALSTWTSLLALILAVPLPASAQAYYQGQPQGNYGNAPSPSSAPQPAAPSVQTYPEPSANQGPAREPVYVWQGNRVNNAGMPVPSAAAPMPQPAAMPMAQSAASDQPQVIELGNNARYITGGIGDEERQYVEAMKGQFNVHITNARADGAFNGDTTVSIRDHNGQQLLSADAGPLFYVQLPPGSYTVQAVCDRGTQQRKITVGASHKSQPLVFRW